jgi:hypothetical protein
MLAKIFNLKITKLDNLNIKVGFPVSSEKAWLERLKNHDIAYIFLYKNEEGNFVVNQILGVKLFS